MLIHIPVRRSTVATDHPSDSFLQIPCLSITHSDGDFAVTGMCQVYHRSLTEIEPCDQVYLQSSAVLVAEYYEA
jgi:hypothetical protein